MKVESTGFTKCSCIGQEGCENALKFGFEVLGNWWCIERNRKFRTYTEEEMKKHWV